MFMILMMDFECVRNLSVLPLGLFVDLDQTHVRKLLGSFFIEHVPLDNLLRILQS